LNGFAAAGQGLRPAQNQLPLDLVVVGVAGAGTFGGLPQVTVPQGTADHYWHAVAAANQWQSDEYSSLTLVADSIVCADRVRDEVKKAGYNAQSPTDFIRQAQQVLLYVGFGLSAFAVIALVVAG